MSDVTLISSLSNLSEDAIICVLCFLEPPDILRLSLTCKKMQNICNLRIVWTNACKHHVTARGYPFATTLTSSFSIPRLRAKVLSAYHLAERWISGVACPQRMYCITGVSGISVSDVKFVPGHDNELLLTISRSIWSAMSLWDMSSETAVMVAHWSPRGAIFTGYAVNEEANSKASLVVSLQMDGESLVKLFHISKDLDATYAFHEIYTIATDMKPVTLFGDVLGLADSKSRTAIWNWKDGTYAVLRNSTVAPSGFQHNECLQVLFAHESILIVRARSVHLFPSPNLKPHDINSEFVQEEYHQIAQHSFGWVDGISAAICHVPTSLGSETPISILVRGEIDDPWAEDAHHLEMYSLLPNTDYASQKSEMERLDEPDLVGNPHPLPSPYKFPPRKTYHIKSHRGTLRCRRVVLGRYGTSAWLEPQERFSTGLVTGLSPFTTGEHWRRQDADRVQRHECLRVAAFPGPLSMSEDKEEIDSRNLLNNTANDWSSFDYDEIGGRIVLGSSFGRIVVVEL